MSRMDTFRRHMALHGSNLPPSRAALACLPCRQSKRRCEGQIPTCSACSAISQPCVWPVSVNKGGRINRKGNTASVGRTDARRQTELLPGERQLDPAGPMEDIDTSRHLEEMESPMDLTAPDADCPGQLAAYEQLMDVYFDKFHHHWPIVHEKSIRLRQGPKILIKTVVTIGLYMTGNEEGKMMAKRILEGFLHKSGELLSSLTPLLEAGKFMLMTRHLPDLQAVLLQAIMIPRLTEQDLAAGIMIDSMLSKAMDLAGVYGQSAIDLASVYPDEQVTNPTFVRESFQRLAVCHFKFRVLFQAFCREKYPWYRFASLTEPSAMRIKIPTPPALFEGMSTTEARSCAMAGGEQLISDVCQAAILAGNEKELDPIDAFQPGLRRTMWLWMIRAGDDDLVFTKHAFSFSESALFSPSYNSSSDSFKPAWFWSDSPFQVTRVWVSLSGSSLMLPKFRASVAVLM
ncbi:hypothetical protein B0T11DRAFT_316228 [Plectosphaerella cucumerina]|uniref:Zn(2)-C6 fungal-type domain-containing protein n=1 Tax=Plectosphaerella cucumerina TaxID=40658 RepID=A0A8K0X6T3_9PEZI|nr:hypothetical protein B0T11DRAFT_316228 [Plectosphaerella cucumerina]